MSIRAGLSVGATTDVSSLEDQVQKYKARTLPVPQPKPNKYKGYKQSTLPNLSHESLALKCVKTLVANFERLPAGDNIPNKYIKEVTSRLPLNLDPKVAALYIFDESYWKRRCVEQLGWARCDIQQHCLMWKQLFFENFIKDRLEKYSKVEDKEKEAENFQALLEEVKTYSDYIFTLHIEQLLSHLDISQVCAVLPNLTKLVASYGVKKVGMKYERILFGMKISDASCLARTLLTCAPNLSTLVLTRNLIDDDLLRMLMTGLMKNSAITSLDLSHNRITNHGARLLSRMLLEKTVLTSLNLSDNMIHAEGGRYLARGLRSNDSLIDLNVRLNRLTDLGGRMLLDGMVDNKSVTRLNLSSNALGQEASAALCSALKEKGCPLAVVDMSCNNLEDDHVMNIAQALESNSTMVSLDLRMNKVSPENEELERILEITYANELRHRNDGAMG